jgi:hypothetical protein
MLGAQACTHLIQQSRGMSVGRGEVGQFAIHYRGAI